MLRARLFLKFIDINHLINILASQSQLNDLFKCQKLKDLNPYHESLNFEEIDKWIWLPFVKYSAFH